MEIGVLVTLKDNGKCFEEVSSYGLKTCQLCCWDFDLQNKEVAQTVKKELKDKGMYISAIWAGWSGTGVWNFTDGPTTLGIVPIQYRKQRIKEIKGWADFAVEAGVKNIITHFGFIPENMTDPHYWEVVEAIRELAVYCKERDLGLWFETGQETPVVILRTIEEINTGNLGINLDPANLLMYGKGNPIDALDVFGKYVKNIHVKDGKTPTNGKELGPEVKPGTGMVRFPEFIKKLQAIGFDGELIIEREISGEEQIKDINQTVKDLKTWMA